MVEDGFEEFHSVLAAKGGKTGDHLVDDAAEAPPVDCSVVALLFDNLGSQVFRGAADRHCFLILKVEGPGQSKICKFYVACLIKQHILRLQTNSWQEVLSVNDILLV